MTNHQTKEAREKNMEDGGYSGVMSYSVEKCCILSNLNDIETGLTILLPNRPKPALILYYKYLAFLRF